MRVTRAAGHIHGFSVDTAMASAALEQELECPICLDLYTDPVTLGCGHNFCRGCMDRALKIQHGSGVYSCPECRAKFSELPPLQRNRTLSHMVENFRSTHGDDNIVLCTYCVDSPVPAAKSCLMCDASLCQKHLRVHSKEPEHVLSDPSRSLEKWKCPIHKKILEYYCTEDAACICVSCCLIGEHRGHNMESLDEASEKKKKKLKEVLQKIITKRLNLMKRIQSLKESKKKAKRKVMAETAKVTDLFQDLRQCLNDLETKVQSEVSRMKEQVLQPLYKVIQKLKTEKDVLYRKIKLMEEMCNTTDPLTVLQEPDTGDLCDPEEEGGDEDTGGHGGGDGGNVDTGGNDGGDENTGGHDGVGEDTRRHDGSGDDMRGHGGDAEAKGGHDGDKEDTGGHDGVGEDTRRHDGSGDDMRGHGGDAEAKGGHDGDKEDTGGHDGVEEDKRRHDGDDGDMAGHDGGGDDMRGHGEDAEAKGGHDGVEEDTGGHDGDKEDTGGHDGDDEATRRHDGVGEATRRHNGDDEATRRHDGVGEVTRRHEKCDWCVEKVSFLCNLMQSVNMTFYVQKRTDISLDIDTASNNLLISDDLKSATWTQTGQNRPDTAERFRYFQVMSSSNITSGRHYWDVGVRRSMEWEVGVCYPSIDRSGGQSDIGYNNKSWSLYGGRVYNNQYVVRHDSNVTQLPHQISSSRFRIYVDYDSGTLSFYDICYKIRHLHTFTATFTEPLRAILRVFNGSITILDSSEY
ncbi:uncharacterized protein [Engystomops pustulosus]|uniref:uncharacterized protein n=1 Tax=Engystomops pustulosus TaxID=76066 RepID=UPI003AFAAE29